MKVQNILTVLLFAVLVTAMLICATQLEHLGLTNETALLNRQIWEAAELYRASDGSYPETLSDLCEKYNLKIDETRFIVHYSTIASNIPPEITVTAREVRR